MNILKNIHCLYWVLFLLFSGIHCKLPGLDRFAVDFSLFSLIQNLLDTGLRSIGGEVRGLIGNDLRMELNATNPEGESSISTLIVNQSGRFRFPGTFASGTSYEVTITRQPSNPPQNCEVAGGTGTIGNASITSILVQCGESLQLATPVFTPAPGEFFNTINVSITSTTLGSQIFYTLDGAEPTCDGVGDEYTASIEILQPTGATAETRILRAIACKEDPDPNSNTPLASNLQVGNYFMTLGQLPAPTTSLTPGTYPNDDPTPPEVTLSAPGAPAGASVHFTTNNSPATCSSPVFNPGDPIVLNFSQTIRAITCLANYTSSSEVSFSYTIIGTVANPTFSNAGGLYNNDLNLVISSPTPGSTVRYSLTTDGSEPGDPNCSTDFPAVSGSVLLNQDNTRIKAIACVNDWTPSDVVTTVNPYRFEVAINPAFNLPNNTSITTSATLSATTTTTGATVRYLTGIAGMGNPDCNSTTVPTELTADGSGDMVLVRAIACRDGYQDSVVISSDYFLTGILNNPTVNLDSGEYPGTQNISFTGMPGVAGQEFAYTLDGSDPVCGVSPAEENINVNASGTLKVRACKETVPRWDPSGIVTRIYTINGQATMPTFDPPPGTYSDEVNVTIGSLDPPGGVIHFSLTGGTPTCGGPNLPNGGTVGIVSTNTELSAIVCTATHLESDLATGTYILQPNQPEPTSGNLPGIFQGNLSLELTAPDSPGATIYWTTDGSDPACPSTGNTGPIALGQFSGDVNVRAIACRTNFTPSPLFTGVYTMNGQLPSPVIGDPTGTANLVTITAQNAPGAGPGAPLQTVCYRTDGTTASCSAATGGACAGGSINYTDPFPVNNSMTISAVSCRENFLASTPASSTINFPDTVGNVVFSEPSGVKNNAFQLTMSVPGGAEIRYTVNGPAPDCTSGTVYGGEFTIGASVGGITIVRAIACSAGSNPSAVQTGTYEFQVADPEFSLDPSPIYNDTQTMSITTITTGGSIAIFYTLDGSIPACSVGGSTFQFPGGTVTLPTTAPFSNQNGSINIRAKGCSSGNDYMESGVVDANYTFQTDPVEIRIGGTALPETPTNLTMNPTTLQFNTGLTPFTKICFRTDGINPLCDAGGGCETGSNFYDNEEEVNINTNTDYLIRTCAAGFAPSPVRSMNFTITDPGVDFRPRIFVTDTKVDGDTSDQEAEDICNTDANRPVKEGVEYTQFRISINRNTDFSGRRWMLEPNTTYYNLKNQVIGTVSGNGSNFGNTFGDVVLMNPVSDSLATVWTGADFSVDTNRFIRLNTRGCGTSTVASWNDTSAQGIVGRADRLNLTFAKFDTNASCDTEHSLYCVEKHPRKRIWVTDNTMTGNQVSNIRCNQFADNNKPFSGIYRALYGHPTISDPAGASWVLRPETTYYRADRTTPVFNTDPNKFIIYPFLNELTADTGIINPWTGLVHVGGTNVLEISSFNCNNWASNTTAHTGTFGAPSSTSFEFINNSSGSGATCNQERPIYCVEE
ncbi:MAG: chitobiase/beta-hexosaminidase C-terminal domain-containing protein [Leptospira sp.]|nr:chitobiase/beta-hexosaminidase C-terminal domain-containing protein [Leptospira sp.]